MKTYLKLKRSFFSIALILFVLSSCNKQETIASEDSTLPAISVAASSSSANGETDSFYVLQQCDPGSKRDSITASSLPSAITGYLASNYEPYTFHKAFTINNAGTITGYTVIIYFNDKPVGLEFDASGNFVKVLEQRERGDMSGKGWANYLLLISAYLETSYPNFVFKKAFIRNNDDNLKGYVVFIDANKYQVRHGV